MKKESEDKEIDFAVEQWVNLVLAHIRAKKQQELNKSKNNSIEAQD